MLSREERQELEEEEEYKYDTNIPLDIRYLYFKVHGTYDSDTIIRKWYQSLSGETHNTAYDTAIEALTTRGDGGSTSYYTLPTNATELGHLIRHKNMSHAIGEAFCALYRLDDNGERKRNLTKAKYYIEQELLYT